MIAAGLLCRHILFLLVPDQLRAYLYRNTHSVAPSFHDSTTVWIRKSQSQEIGRWLTSSLTGCWFGTWILWFSIQLGIHHPNWRSHIFQRGRYTTNQMICLWFVGLINHNLLVGKHKSHHCWVYGGYIIGRWLTSSLVISTFCHLLSPGMALSSRLRCAMPPWAARRWVEGWTELDGPAISHGYAYIMFI